MSNITIAIATKSDLPTLNRLYADMDEKPLMSDKQITAIWERIQQVPDYFIYLAYLEDIAIGTFSLLFMPTMMHPGFHKSAILDSVTIATIYRGKGLGKQMMQKALKISAEAFCYKVTLSSNLKRDATHKFYKSLGFKQHGWSFSYSIAEI
ncbi:MAG: N-acetyltransferase family protein [Xenococcaceae cyanobacterium]